MSRPFLDLAKLDEVDVESAAGAIELQLAALGRLGSSLPHTVPWETLVLLQNYALRVRYGDALAGRDLRIVLQLTFMELQGVDEEEVEKVLRIWVLREFLFHGRE